MQPNSRYEIIYTRPKRNNQMIIIDQDYQQMADSYMMDVVGSYLFDDANNKQKDEMKNQDQLLQIFSPILQPKQKRKFYVGSLIVVGTSNYLIAPFSEDRQLKIHYTTRTSLCLEDKNFKKITVELLFANYLQELEKKNIATIKYYYNIPPGTLSGKISENMQIIPIRMDIYINQHIFQSSFYEIDKTQPEMYQGQYKDKENQLLQKLITCQMLIYLVKKCNPKIKNRSLVVPPPKINLMMRNYRTQTIGHKTKSKRNPQRLIRKIKQWKQKLERANQYYPCYYEKKAKQNNEKIQIKDYYENMQQYFINWQQKKQFVEKQMFVLEKLKMINRKKGRQLSLTEKSILENDRDKNLKQIGANIFIEKFKDFDWNQPLLNMAIQIDQASDQEQQNLDQQLNRKNNVQLLKRFEEQNKYFVQHQNPQAMLTELKPYQLQALQWMKIRQGKIPQNQLFNKSYSQSSNLQFQRKLSIFWEEVQLLTGETIYFNQLTGHFSQQFKPGNSIKGGILADQMGLGKTIMMLSLLADQKFEGTNLIVVPVNVLNQWQKQIKKHCGQSITILNFNQQPRNKRRKISLLNYKIVLITYATLAAQYKNYENNAYRRQQNYIFDYTFRRIILDEAHQIRQVGTLQFKAAMILKSEFKWCLTGTLVQNSEKDLFPILKFLEVQFFSQEKWWNRYIKNSISFQSKLNILYVILRPILLRRTKNTTLLELSEKIYNKITPSFSEQQQKIYKQLQKGAVMELDLNMKGDKNFVYAFSIINKLRQFCCHPQMVLGNYKPSELQNKSTQEIIKIFFSNKLTEEYKNRALQNLIQCNQQNCIICLNISDKQNACITICGHSFCQNCIKTEIRIRGRCPSCRHPLTQSNLINRNKLQEQKQMIVEKKSLLSNVAKNSTKMSSILEIINSIRERNQKCVIFTQWIAMIDLLQQNIQKLNQKYATVKGTMTHEKRQKQIQRFRTDQTCKFIIISIRAGNTGLNLQVANNVMICDPWWNPNQQDQAIGRVHRFGQTKVVNVYRLFMKNSIQQKIQKLNMKKRILSQQIMMNKQSLLSKNMDLIGQLLEMMRNGQ